MIRQRICCNRGAALQAATVLANKSREIIKDEALKKLAQRACPENDVSEGTCLSHPITLVSARAAVGGTNEK